MENMITIKNRIIEIDRPFVMGILNLTPDSFFDGGKYNHAEMATSHAERMIQEGVDIIDLGAMSSRPGAVEISEKEELERLLPALKEIRERFPNAILSIDTYRANIAYKALLAGADIINDISGGVIEPEIYSVVADFQAPYVLMHMRGTPVNMQKDVQYKDIIKEISLFFSKRIELLRKNNVKDIIIDPGFGFGKSLDDNYYLLKNVEYFKFHEVPILAGLSRKSMVNKVLSCHPDEALFGTLALQTIALMKGVNILRTHDVKETADMIKVFERFNNIHVPQAI